ncbi:diglucosylglycerate octanoyltransferase [Nocardia mangyaensis]|uniref:diglucosylglycerate octanoyltransferase n=1 Tax=Nocardia mangyaensis TaxID=2213200 RepID=UPI000AC9A493|nr:diglucosylglycerate octanoyltransferase [Nocardia mangyaensis]
MSSEEPVRSVPDELFQQVTAKAGRQLPDALFGPPPARPARSEREEPIRSVPDELFQQVTARSTRSLPDALFGPPPAPVTPEPEATVADESDTGTDDSAVKKAEEPPPSQVDATAAVADATTSSAVQDTDVTAAKFAAPGEDRVVAGAATDTSDDVESAAVTADSDQASASTTAVAAAAPGSTDPGRAAPTSPSALAGSPVGTSASTGPSLADPAPDEPSTADVDGIVETDPTVADPAPATSAVHTATAPVVAEFTEPATSVADASTASGTAAASASATTGPVAAVSGGPAVAAPAVVEAGGMVTSGLSAVDTAVALTADSAADTRATVLEAAAESSATAAATEVSAGVGSVTASVVAGGSAAANAPVTGESAVAGTPVASAEAGTAAAVAAGSVVVEPDAVGTVAEHTVPHSESLAVAGLDSVLVQEDAADRPVESASPRPVLLVIADSLAYYGPKGGLPADDPRIWPNMVAAELDWDVELIARIGWTCRDAYWALIGDPRVWAAVPRAGAVVFAVGGMDTLPSPLPTALRELIRYIRPPRLRRGVRASYNWLQPKLSKLGRPVALPPRVSVDYLEQSREALAHLRPELPVVAVLPSVHKCDAYGRVHRGRARAVKALQAWSGKTSVPLVDLGAAVRDDIESGSANPDGIHWGWAGHAAVATAMTKALQEVR